MKNVGNHCTRQVLKVNWYSLPFHHWILFSQGRDGGGKVGGDRHITQSGWLWQTVYSLFYVFLFHWFWFCFVFFSVCVTCLSHFFSVYSFLRSLILLVKIIKYFLGFCFSVYVTDDIIVFAVLLLQVITQKVQAIFVYFLSSCAGL